MNQTGNISVYFLLVIAAVSGFGLVIGTMALTEMTVTGAYSENNYMPYMSQSAASYAVAVIQRDISKAKEAFLLQSNTTVSPSSFSELVKNIPSQSLIKIEQPFQNEINQKHSIEVRFVKKDAVTLEAQVIVYLNSKHLQNNILLGLPKQLNENLKILK